MLTGFYRIACGIPQLHLGHPAANAVEISLLYQDAVSKGVAVLTTPELSLTGATCGDLFEQHTLLHDAEAALDSLRKETRGHSTLLLVGLPLLVSGRLYNAAALLQDGKILGVTAKTFPQNHRDVYEKRHFRSVREYTGDGNITLCGKTVPFGGNLLFDAGDSFRLACCAWDDMQAVQSPADTLALQGATIFLVPAAVPETAGESRRRQSLLEACTRRLACIGILTNAGVYESSTDGAYPGQALVCANGETLLAPPLFFRQSIASVCDINPGWMEQHRRSWSGFLDATADTPPRVIPVSPPRQCTDLEFRFLSETPFLPVSSADLGELCQEVLRIQANALARRMECVHAKSLVVGLSGGLDSTLALLVCAEACDLLELPHSAITAVTMPGMGTTDRTHDNAREMAKALKTGFREIPIGEAVAQHFRDIGHNPAKLDVVYENSQARERTQILMDLANGCGGLVVGTGDLSEIALGWCTYNGDHISMYAVNAGVPKTLVRAMVEDYAARAPRKLASILRDINATPVSPELLPGGSQSTESILGSYTLHDFYLYHFLRHGETPENLLALAQNAFDPKDFPMTELKRVLKLFLKRFFTQQFKRNCSTDGPKVLEFALSPRGDWKMPSDMEYGPWEMD